MFHPGVVTPGGGDGWPPYPSSSHRHLPIDTSRTSSLRSRLHRYGHLFDGHDEQLRSGLDGLYAESVVSRSCHETDDVDVAPQPERETVPVTRGFLERTTGFEPTTPTLARLCSTN